MISPWEVLLVGLLIAAAIAVRLLIKRAAQRRRAWLLQHGNKVVATITRIQEYVTRNRRGSPIGRSYRVTALWDDPQTQEIYEFTRRLGSPAGYQERLPVPVWIAPNNPRRYWVGVPEASREATWFQQHGKPITATILTVKEQETGIPSPVGHYLVTALWDDPHTREVYEFRKLVDDPGAYHPRRPLPVLIDPDNPHHYQVGQPDVT